MTPDSAIGEVPRFYKSLATDPIDTLKTTWRGVTEATPDNTNRVLVPALAVTGLTVGFLGAATGNLLSIGIGLANTSMAAAHYYALGSDLPPKGLEAGSPG